MLPLPASSLAQPQSYDTVKACHVASAWSSTLPVQTGQSVVGSLLPSSAHLAACVQAISSFAEAVHDGMSSMMDSFLDGADLEELVNDPSPLLSAAQASRA